MKTPQLPAPEVPGQNPLETNIRSMQPPQQDDGADEQDQQLEPKEEIDIEEEMLIDRIYEVYNLYRTCEARANIERIWKACIWAYKGGKPRRTDPTKDTIVMKETFRQAHTLKPQVFKQFFSQPKLFQYAPMVPGVDDKMRVATETVHHQIRQFKQLTGIKNFVWCMILMGTSYVRMSWREFARPYMKPFMLHDAEKGEFWERKTTEIVTGYPCAEFIPPNEIFSHPYYEDPRESPFVFHRRTVSGADLKTMVKEGYLDAESVKRVSDDKLSAPSDMSASEFRLGQGFDTLGLNSLPNDDVPHEMLTCWSTNGMEYVVIDQEVLARCQMIEGGIAREDGELQAGPIPILCLRNYPQIREHWGIPEPYTIIDDQALLNKLYTMLQDAMMLTGGPMYKATTTGGKAISNFTAKSGAILWVNKMEDVEIIPPTNHADKIVNALGFVANQCKSVTGILDNLAGAGDEGADTATMGTKLQNAATVRIEDRVEDAVPIMQELYGYYYILNQRHLKAPVEFSMKGDDGLYAFYTGLPSHFDEPLIQTEVQLANAAEADPEAASKWMQFFQIAGKHPNVNSKAVLESWLRALDRRSPRQYMSSPQTTEVSSLEQNRQWEAFGIIPDPDPNENHDVAIGIHQPEMMKPEFVMADPIKKLQFARHLQLHMNYQQAIMLGQGQAAGAPQAGPGAPNGAPMPQANASANGAMNMGADGAAQAGAPPPPPNPNAGLQAPPNGMPQ